MLSPVTVRFNLADFCGADPLVRGRRPRRPTSFGVQRDEGVPRGPGVRPTAFSRLAAASLAA